MVKCWAAADPVIEAWDGDAGRDLLASVVPGKWAAQGERWARSTGRKAGAW